MHKVLEGLKGKGFELRGKQYVVIISLKKKKIMTLQKTKKQHQLDYCRYFNFLLLQMLDGFFCTTFFIILFIYFIIVKMILVYVMSKSNNSLIIA